MSDTTIPPTSSIPEPAAAILGPAAPLPRRTFLKGAAVAAGGAVAATVAACAPAVGTSRWAYAPLRTASVADAGMDHGRTAQAATPAPDAEPLPEGWSEHDRMGRDKVRRFVGNLAGPLGLAPFIGEPTDDPEFTKVPHGNQPLEPTMDGDVKVFTLTIDEIEWRIDALSDPIKALGYNGMWPGPVLRVVEGDRVRAVFTNNLSETTGVHFHGMEFDDHLQDGVPFVTQPPIIPGATYTYEFVARTAGSHMYHSHHNATDQVGRGLLGAFIVEPKDEAERPSVKYNLKPEHDVVFIHNDSLGGFTINGHGFPATAPIVANVGDTVYLRYMNEGVMMHPWHTHGFRQRIVARDGAPLGTAEFRCDTLGVNPGERYDSVVVCDRPGVWAFHCHVLPHAETMNGMFGMVTALVVLPAA